MISLSHAGRALAAALLLGGLALAGSQLGWNFERLGQGQAAQAGEGAKIARRLIVYRLDPVRQTTFRFTQPVRQARLITHPILAAGSAGNGESHAYAIRAELLDGQGQVIAQREIHSQTALLRPDGSRRGPYRFYRGSTELIALSDEVRVASAQAFAAIRLISADRAPDLVAIDVRVSERRPLLTSTAATAFMRYSADDQARLASPNAFPPELLTAAERANIAVNQWRPVGPTGIDGRDYRMRVLYEEAGEPDDSDELRYDPEDSE
jgi:hypothetical protein